MNGEVFLSVRAVKDSIEMRIDMNMESGQPMCRYKGNLVALALK